LARFAAAGRFSGASFWRQCAILLMLPVGWPVLEQL
jgi:hypothetical protein